MKKIGSILVVVAIMASALTVIGVKSASGEDDGLPDIVETAIENGNFTTLINAVTEADLVATLSGAGPFTVFAPTDEAFENLPEGTINKLLNNNELLNEVLTYHVVSGNFSAAAVSGLASLTTLQGEDITINATSGIMVDGAEVILEDVNCFNGIIHAIDNVMLPPSMFTTVTIEYPMGGENIGGIIPVEWTAENVADNELEIQIEIKNDTATEWDSIVEGEENDGIYNYDATALDPADQYMLKVTAMNPIGITYFTESNLFDITDMTVTPKTIAFNETDDVYAVGTSGTVELFNPDETLVASDDGSPGDVFFFNTEFDNTGTWIVEDSVEGIFFILVTPIKLNITADPTEIDFTKSGSESYVAVSGQVTNPDGTPTVNATVEIWAPGVIPSGATTPIKTVATDGTGAYMFSDQIRISLYGAGTYNITARIGDVDDADALGYTYMAVASIEANVTLYDMEDVAGGFLNGEIVFEVLYPDDGTGLLAGNDYNVSVWMGDMLYSYRNISDGTDEGNMTFSIYGNYLNITPVDIWELGDYTLMVDVNYAGGISWEYTDEADFTIPGPDPVNIFVTPTEIDVETLGINAQIITVQILGNTLYTYGDPANLSVGPAPDYENITDRIMIEGDLLYTPPGEAYEWIGEGTWEISVFPMKGTGNINIDVSWPGNGTDSKTVNITNGGHITVDPTTVIVDDDYTFTVTVKTDDGNPVTRAEEIQLYYEVPSYYEGTAWTLIEGKTGVYDANGVFTFDNVTIDQAAVNVVVFAHFLTDTDQYAYALIRSNPAHDLNIGLAPGAVLSGERTEYTINVTRDEPYADDFELYLLNATAYAEFSSDELDIDDMVPIATETKANFTIINIITEPDMYYLYVRTADKKHDNLGSEPSFEVTEAGVSVSPSLLVKNVDKNMTLEFTVMWNGEPVNGTLYIDGIAETGSYEAYVDGGMIEVPIVDGEGNITNVTATELTNNTDMITFSFKSETDGSIEADVSGEMEVVPPTVTVAPDEIYLAEENLITLTITHPLTNDPVPDMAVMAAIPTGTMDLGKTASNGKVTFGIVPMMTGYMALMVEGDEVDQQIEIVVGLKIHIDTDLEKNKEVTITVTTRGGTIVEGATVMFGTVTVGTTDSNGEINYEPEDKGDFTITASLSGYADATKEVEVKEGPGTPGFALFAAIIGILAALLIVRRRRR